MIQRRSIGASERGSDQTREQKRRSNQTEIVFLHCSRCTLAWMTITYRLGNDLDLDTVIDLYRDSTLGLRRPVDDRPRMKQMLERANLVVSAWDSDLMVGISRSLSDFCYATYLSDLAVRL